MTETAEQIKTAILKLSPEEQADLASFLWDELEADEVVAAESGADFDAELLRRFGEMESGKDPGEPVDKVMRDLREKHS